MLTPVVLALEQMELYLVDHLALLSSVPLRSVCWVGGRAGGWGYRKFLFWFQGYRYIICYGAWSFTPLVTKLCRHSCIVYFHTSRF